MAKAGMSGFNVDKFMKGLEKDVLDNAKEQALEQAYDVHCPHCKGKIRIGAGKQVCPLCGKEIDHKLTVQID